MTVGSKQITKEHALLVLEALRSVAHADLTGVDRKRSLSEAEKEAFRELLRDDIRALTFAIENIQS